MQQIAEAKRALPVIDALLKPADKGLARRWLIMLGNLVAGDKPVADLQLKLAAYAGMLGHPEAAFTQVTLKAAGRKFKFFPSFSETSDFLDEQIADLTNMRKRLDMLAHAKPTAPKPDEPGQRWEDMTPAERAHFDHTMAPFKRVPIEPDLAAAAPTTDATPKPKSKFAEAVEREALNKIRTRYGMDPLPEPQPESLI